MQIQKIKLAQLVPNTGQIPGLPSNPRQWTKSDVDRIAKSLAETPELFEARPIIAYPFDGKFVILGGNLRYEGARKNKDTEVPVIVLPEDTPADKLKEIVIKDNGQFGSWDFDALANNWDNGLLQDWGVPVWDAETKDEPEEQEATEDNFDEDTDEIQTRTKLGDIWQLGEHLLMCGDSTSPSEVAKLMNNEKADLVFTDPPYGVSYVGVSTQNGKEWEMITNDDLRGSELFNFLLATFKNIAATLKEDGAFYIWFASINHIEFETAINAANLRVKQELIWDKGMVLGRSDYHWAYEPCLYGVHKDSNCVWYGDRKQKTFLALNRTKIRELKKEQMEEILLNLHEGRTCWRIDRDNVASYLHPTQKPVELAARAMRNSSAATQIVLDLFGGSGTTLIAAEQMNRRARVMELDPHYCDVIIARWEKLTGQTATKIN